MHENPSCGPAESEGQTVAGGAAGPHHDPQNAETHRGPEGEGHLGDLPVLVVEADGRITTSVTAPRLKLTDLKGRSLMIHEGGDTYSDEPKDGGGAVRAACGVVP